MNTTTRPAFTTAGFALATAALFAPATAIDRALDKAGSVKQEWAVIAATGILAKDIAFTMDDVKSALLTAAKARMKGKKADALSFNDISSTVKGWYYDLKRADGNGLLPLLLEGQSLTGLRRATETTQNRKNKAPAKGSIAKKEEATPAPLPVMVAPTTLEAIADQLETDAKRLSMKAMVAQQAAIARILAASATMARKVEAHVQAAAQAKADAANVKKAAATAKAA